MATIDTFNVNDVHVDAYDITENRITEIFGKSWPNYAVYQNTKRVGVQYADEDDAATAQRKNMANLNGLRAQINGLIDGWRNSRNDNFKARARRYDADVAAALVMCLEERATN